MKKKIGPEDLVLFESTHRYFLEGRELTSVTQAIQGAGITDFSKVPYELMERTQLIGDYVHEIARLYALNKLDEDTVDPQLKGYLAGVKLFFQEQVSKVEKVEARVFDLGLGYAGQPDIVYKSYTRKRRLDDYKTAKTSHPATQLQTAAYKRPYELIYHKKIDERGGVLIRGTGSYHRDPYNDPADFGNFVHVLGVARWKQSHKIKGGA